MKTTKPLLGILTITLGLLAHVQAQPFLTNGLVAYYPFNGNANDESGNGNNGTNFGANLATDRFGLTNSCYSFAINNHIDLGSGIHLGGPGTGWSASVWFKTTDTKYDSTFLTDQNPIPDTNYSTHFWIAAGNLGMNCKGGASPVFIVRGTATLNDGLWHFAAFVADGNSNLILYADGRLDGRASYDSTLDYDGYPFWRVNYLNNAYNDSLVGSIDDVRIYNRALSASEVQQLYDYESGPRVDLIKAVKPSFRNLTLTTNYQMQVSTDLNSWTNQGAAFTATNSSMVWPQYFDVANWNQLFFRLQVAP